MKFFLAFTLFISLIANLLFYVDMDVKNHKPGGNEISYQEISVDELRFIAMKLGVAHESVDRMDSEQLLTEIKVKMNESIGFYANTLSAEEFKIVEDLLYGEEKIIGIIKKQNEFCQQIQGRDIIILQ